MRRSLLLLPLVLVSLTTSAGEWGSRGISQGFALLGERLVVADGRGVTVYDVADPAAIRRIDIEAGDAESHDVAISGTDLVTVATSDGVEWFSMAADGTLTPQGTFGDAGPATEISATPAVVAAGGARSITLFDRKGHGLNRRVTVPTRSAVRDLLFVKGLLYAALEDGGIAIIGPTGVTVETILVMSPSIALAGDVLWVGAGQHGIYAYDVSNPASPRLLVSRVGSLEIHADDVAFANGHLYVRDGNRLVRIYDVSDVRAPREVGQLDEWVHLLATDGADRLYLAGTIYDRENLPFATGVPVRVHDVSAGGAPRFAGEFRDLAGPLSGVFTNGSIAYVSDPPYFRTIDVSRTAEPREMASIEIENLQDSVRVKDGFAIVYGRGFVNLIDVTDPWRPQLLSTWDALGHPRSSAAMLKGAYVEANQHSGLHIMDITDPRGPWQISGRIWHYHDVAAGDDVVYALQAGAFRTLDIRDRTRVVDAWSVTQTLLQVDTVPPNSAFPPYLVTSRNDGLDIWSLEDRFVPRKVAFANVPHPGIFGTSESGITMAYGKTLWRIDLNGVAADTGLRVTSPMQISAAGEKIVVADRYRLRVYGPDTAAPPPPPPDPPSPPARRRAVRRR